MTSFNFSRTPQEVPHINSKYRTIKTAIPAPGTEAILADLDKYESRSMLGQLPIVWDKAKGFSIFDQSGNKWIDFTSTIFVTNIGHANPNLISSLKEQLDKDLLHSYAYATEIRSKYLKKLIKSTPNQFEKAFLLSAGTEATEAALKLMRLYGQKTGKRRLGIICLVGNWHGRTMGAQMMSRNVKQKEWIGYQDPDIHHIPFPYPWNKSKKSGKEFLTDSIKQLNSSGVSIEKDICGFMLETFQGWGAIFYPTDYVKCMKDLCDEYGILLTFDEMQAGFARTGKMFGYQHYDVEPDLICCGKGISSGLPLSAVLGRKELMDLPETGDMSSTHSANPLVCAAGLATLKEIEQLRLVSESERKGKILFNRLKEIQKKFEDRISYVFGKGMIAAILFQDPNTGLGDSEFASKVVEKAMHKGLLVVHTGRESIKIAPPLIIEDEALMEGLDTLEEAIREISLVVNR